MSETKSETDAKWERMINRLDKKTKEEKIPSKTKATKKIWTSLSLRIPEDMLNDIDICVEKRIGLNRTAWILESLQEKLERKNKNE